MSLGKPFGKSQRKSRRRPFGGAGGQGTRWMRAAALLLAVAGTAAGLAGCEYPDDVTAPTAAPSRTGRAAPPPVPAGPDIATAETRNLDELKAVLGARPAGIVLEGAGGMGGAGLRKSVSALAKGTYTVTAACTGAPKGYLSISQDELRDGGNLELTIECGKAMQAQVDLAAGPAHAQAERRMTGPGTGEVAGFWIVPAAPGS